jgi:hypothetical protein
VKKIKSYYDKDKETKIFEKLRIDMVLLGTYFKVPENSNPVNRVDDIGSNQDSFYRAKDQLNELYELVTDEWQVYYAAIPGFDDICGEFRKNGAKKRKSHFLELAAALAAFFEIGNDDVNFFHTALPHGKSSDIGLELIPFGSNLKPMVKKFMGLISIMACQVYPRFMQKVEEMKKDPYVKWYVRRIGDDSTQKIDKLRLYIKGRLDELRTCFEFWYEIQHYTKLSGNVGGIIEFSPDEEFSTAKINELWTILENINDTPQVAWRSEGFPNVMPLCTHTWLNYLPKIKPDKDASVIASLEEKELFEQMMKDIYKAIAVN